METLTRCPKKTRQASVMRHTEREKLSLRQRVSIAAVEWDSVLTCGIISSTSVHYLLQANPPWLRTGAINFSDGFSKKNLQSQTQQKKN